MSDRRPAGAGEDPSGEELRKAAVHGLRWSAISRPTIEVVQLVSIVVLARLIIPAEFGRFAVAAITYEVANLLVAGGLSVALVQRRALDRLHLQTGLSLALLGGFAVSALMVGAAILIVDPIFGSRTALFMALLAPLCLVEALTAVPVANLRRRMDFRRLSEIEILSNVLRVLVSVGLALAGLEGEALVLGIIAGSLAGLLLAWVSAPPPLPRFDRAVARDILNDAVPVSLATISMVGFGNVDYVIIGARLGARPTGFYYRAYTVAVEYQNKVATVMGQVGFPVLARSNDAADQRQLYRQMVHLLTIVLFPLLVLVAITAPVFVPFLFGARWDPAIVPMQILAIGGASTILFTAVGTVFMATSRNHALLGFGWVQFIVYGLTVWLVAPLGIVAVAINAAIVHALFAVFAYVLMLHGSDERPLQRLWSDIAPATVSCVGLVAIALPVSLMLTALHLPPVLWLAGVGLVAIPPYLLTLRTCYPAVWRSECTALERILPGHRRLNGLKRRLAAAAAVH